MYLDYVYDAPPGGSAPVWNDACPTPPGPNDNGCVVTSKLVRYTIDRRPTSWCRAARSS